ncbi:hypothetical protein EAO70_30665 [Streptomyces sp. adm13(2018)]|nr:hypothetical protein EAO70_30665 [Streptomyces sp. adm13(2018)]
MPVLAWPMTSVPVRATGRVISWMGKGLTMPTASRASAVSGRIPRSRKVVVRVLPLLWTRDEANEGGRTVPGTVPARSWGSLPGGTGPLPSLERRTAEVTPPRVRRKGCRAGADRATDRASSFMSRPTAYVRTCESMSAYSAGALSLYPGFAHVCWEK